MGVAGSGKSEIGKRLATRLQRKYVEGDDYHPQQNLDKMAAGIPLTDADRHAWLLALQQILRQAASEGRAIVLSCSALKRRYRDLLREGDPISTFVHLQGERSLIAARMRSRTGHFMPIDLLDSQFRDLEPLQPDEAGIVVEIDKDPDRIVDEIADALKI
jgi:gluconokinase